MQRVHRDNINVLDVSDYLEVGNKKILIMTERGSGRAVWQRRGKGDIVIC